MNRPDHVEEQLHRGLQALCFVREPSKRAAFVDLCAWIHSRQQQMEAQRGGAAAAMSTPGVAGAGGTPHQAVPSHTARAYSDLAPAPDGSPCQTEQAAGARAHSTASAPSPSANGNRQRCLRRQHGVMPDEPEAGRARVLQRERSLLDGCAS